MAFAKLGTGRMTAPPGRHRSLKLPLRRPATQPACRLRCLAAKWRKPTPTPSRLPERTDLATIGAFGRFPIVAEGATVGRRPRAAVRSVLPEPVEMAPGS